MDSFSSDDYAYLLENYKRLIQDQDNQIEYVKESSGGGNYPIIVQDQYEERSENIKKFPYLRRGAGLTRYGMNIEHFKDTPDLYKKKSFKSFTHQKTTKINYPKPEKVIRAGTTKSTNMEKEVRKIPNVKKVPDRIFALTASKAFDEEVIPAVRHQRGGTFEVPIPDRFFKRIESPKKSNLPKTPIRNLVLKNDAKNMPEEFEEELQEEISNVARKLSYDPPVIPERETNKNYANEMEEIINSTEIGRHKQFIAEPPKINSSESEEFYPHHNKIKNKYLKSDALQRNGLTPGKQKQRYDLPDEHLKQKEELPKRMIYCENETRHFQNNEESDFEPIKINTRKIAEAMKRKGLTDNVKKHLSWNTTPRKRHPVCIVKKIKVKKSKPRKKEPLNIHELKDRLKELEEEKNKFKIENYKIKKLEKNYTDEKLKLDKLRKELENKIKEEKEEIELEKEKLFEDQKKLKRDKLAFEKYSQETRNLPSRDDREQIRALRVELETTKEIQKTKEARNGALLAQLRNRIAILERENKELKEDLEDATKVTLKKVRFETEGKVKGKIIDAINKQLEIKVKESKTGQRSLSAREKSLASSKPLRRSKSAVDLKPSLVKTRSRVLSNGAVPITNKESACENLVETLLGDQSINIPEVIDLIGGGTNEGGKDSEYDSGMESRPSSSEDCSLRSGSTESAPDTYSAILDIKRRVGNILGEENTQVSDKTQENNKINSKDLHEKLENSNFTRNHCAQEFVCGNVCDLQSSASNFPSKYLTADHCPLKTNLENLNTIRSNYNSGRKGDLVCSRHGVPIMELNRRSSMGQNVTMDRNIVRTELRNGDIEEEEIHSGVRRMYCGQCGSCETTYRSNPGYRRTTTSEGNTMEEHPDGKRVCRYKSGEIVHEYPYGVKVIVMPNGDRETTKPGSKTLERPDGIVRTVYDDGRQETRYPSGRVRIKNRFGHLIMDTGGFA